MVGYKEGGWKEKYVIQKTSGKAVDPDAQYFILRFDEDPHARVAMAAYANSVRKDNAQFARDIMDKLAKTEKKNEFGRCGCGYCDG